MIKSCKKPPVYFESTTGSFYSQYAGLPLKSCRVDLPVNQSGSGTPSPTNIRDFIPYTALDFTANGTVKTFTFGQNVYIGYLDVLTGVLTVTHEVEVFDGSEDEVWLKSVSYSGGYYFHDWAVTHFIASSTDHIQNIGTTVNNLIEYANGTNVCFFDRALNFKVDNSLYPTIQDFRDFLANNNLQVCYPLVTPITIPLGGMEINTILGLNSLSSSVGNISAEYLKAGR